jgi:hypothetical protein
MCSSFVLFVCLFLVGLGFELRASCGTLPLEAHLQSIFALVILKMGSYEPFAWDGLEP